MGLGRMVSRRRLVAVGAGAVGVLVLAGCELGVAPVTYELVDVNQGNFRIGQTGLASGDIDGDGDIDVAVTGRNATGVLTNDGSGGFVLDVRSGTGSQPSLVDVDGDGDLDLVSAVPANESGSDVVPSIRRNDGTGGFGAFEVVEPTPPPGQLTALVASDVNGDGAVDLLAALRIGHGRFVATYLNDGTGAFGPPVTSSLGFTSDTATPVHLVAGDLDGDGAADVVATDTTEVTTPGGDTVERTVALVGRNDGTGAFTATGGPIEAGYNGVIYALFPALADLDHDGNLDLALGGPGLVTTLLGDGAGGFGAPVSSPISGAHSIELVTPADIDGDGNVDLVGFDDPLDARHGIVAYGDGSGGVDESLSVDTGTRLGGDGTPAVGIRTTDIDGDGDPDVLFLAGSLGVLENANGGR